MSQLNIITNKIITKEELKPFLSRWKFKGDKIVFTNGCFDILHRGHIEYLAKASEFGQRLIIGLNTDKSVSKIKGPDRPVQDQLSRAVILSSLRFVDFVLLFDEETPYELIKYVQPDFLVKGKDYNVEDVVGYDIVTKRGGEVVTVELTEGYSTTNIIEKAIGKK